MRPTADPEGVSTTRQSPGVYRVHCASSGHADAGTVETLSIKKS
jgi:hypothetical protein